MPGQNQRSNSYKEIFLFVKAFLALVQPKLSCFLAYLFYKFEARSTFAILIYAYTTIAYINKYLTEYSFSKPFLI